MSQIPLDASARADDPHADKIRADDTHEVMPDLTYKRLAMVNVAFIGVPQSGDRRWVLVDAALPKTADLIAKAAEERFGKNARPAAILLTHAHFDHVSALEELGERWDAPIYAHPLEHPYLNGTASYPPPDPTVGGGIMPLTSPLYPRGPVNVSSRLQPLPSDGSVPSLPGWRWIHTPGHTPGHVSFWRDSDRALIVGDAFITTNQESAYSVATQKPEMHGPPMYFTVDWDEAHTSVEALHALRPELIITGHGRAMHGPQMQQALSELVQNFARVAVPPHGKYTRHPLPAGSPENYVR